MASSQTCFLSHPSDDEAGPAVKPSSSPERSPENKTTEGPGLSAKRPAQASSSSSSSSGVEEDESSSSDEDEHQGAMRKIRSSVAQITVSGLAVNWFFSPLSKIHPYRWVHSDNNAQNTSTNTQKKYYIGLSLTYLSTFMSTYNTSEYSLMPLQVYCWALFSVALLLITG